MQKAALFFLGFVCGFVSYGQKQKKIIKVTPSYTLKQTEFFYRLGDVDIRVVVYKYNTNPGIVLISPHDDEETAIEVSKAALRVTGGTLIKINNNHQRLITFRIHGSSFRFDPNRMFTTKGIITSLNRYHNSSPAAVSKIKSFARFILSMIPANTRNVIALHNNHKGQYSIESYDYKGNLYRDSRAVYTDSTRDKDDFFLTTDEVFYNKIRGYRYNVILQDNTVANDDGSLSIYYGRRNKSYVNVETEHGKAEEQIKMLMVAINPPKRKNKNSVLYNYEMTGLTELRNAGTLKIYFGDKQIGTLLSSTYSTALNITFGQLETNKNFPLHSNCDFFISGKGDKLKMDVRIDPTRENNPLDRLKETIQVKVEK